MKNRTVLILIGPQGSGKGTQATILADQYGFKIIGMGELLRGEVHKKTPLGDQLGKLITNGLLVPDSLTLQLVRDELARMPQSEAIIFDGFPRTVDQARELDTIITITQAVNIEVPYEVSVKRIAGRLMCEHGHSYNTYFLPPRREGICNVDKLPLFRREDDTEASVINRLGIYQEVTTKVIAYYREQGKLVTINGDASIFAVSHEIKQKVLSGL